MRVQENNNKTFPLLNIETGDYLIAINGFSLSFFGESISRQQWDNDYYLFGEPKLLTLFRMHSLGTDVLDVSSV